MKRVYLLIAVAPMVFSCMQAKAAQNLPAEPNSGQTQQEIKVTLPPGIGDKAAPLDGLTWIKGKPVKIEPGKVYLIEFWATWCPPCKEAIPHLSELQVMYTGKAAIIGISTEPVETVKPFVESMGDQMDYHVAADPEGKVIRNYSQAYNMQTIPHGFIVDAQGKIAWYGHPQEGMDMVLAQVVAGTFDPVAFARQKAEAEALNAQLSNWYVQYFEKMQSGESGPEAEQIANSFIEKAHPDALLAFTWNNLIKFKTNENARKIALKAAEKANLLTNGVEPVVLDTYATALFENGKLNEAITAEQKALQLSQMNPRMAEMFKQRLMEFKTQGFKKQ
ncbi:MAG: redoxin domain-containing protein [Planctomycetaceae bacterium]|nr:redoxin domain-containing protein [Planctomycetaceae bacterium]